MNANDTFRLDAFEPTPGRAVVLATFEVDDLRAVDRIAVLLSGRGRFFRKRLAKRVRLFGVSAKLLQGDFDYLDVRAVASKFKTPQGLKNDSERAD